MNNIADSLTFTVPLALPEHLTAQRFSEQQTNPRKIKQVYLNTLAVYAVDFYLRCRGIETDLSASDSWDLVTQTLMNVADLEIKNLGKLECRPVLPDSQFCHIPLEVWSDRIGYVAVKLSESLREATLLGFVETTTQEELPVSELRSLEELEDLLAELTAKVTPRQTQVNQLLQWFDNIFEPGWQAIEALIAPQELSFVRNLKVRRGKVIDLGIELAGHPFILIINLSRESEDTVAVNLQVYPTGENSYLPLGLKLIVLDESEEIFKEVTARTADKFIQYQFEAELGDRFGVKVDWQGVSITEEFAISELEPPPSPLFIANDET
ncbi:DUF1822 family protein [Microseira sp. BLCC-F43]|jgi:hypothetical protein|uniref:DUF1822 family protein n=1 Tax=Microseira sp. BLCC-F43 TaxID=3153602 RepID=UPI0035B9E0F6